MAVQSWHRKYGMQFWRCTLAVNHVNALFVADKLEHALQHVLVPAAGQQQETGEF